MSIDRRVIFLWLSLTVMIAAFVVQYYTDITQMLGKWKYEDFSYCYLVPLVFLYLVFINRDQLKNIEPKSSLLGFAVIIFSGLIYLIGKMGSVETLNAISIWVTIVGAGLIVLGNRIIRKLAFPLVIFAFIIPLPPFLNNLFTFKLKLISSALSVRMMQWTGLSVFREGNIIDLGITQLQVVDACSGLRYVYPLLLMGFIFAYLFHKKYWERLIVILATIPISVVSNALRIAITGYLTIHVSPETAESFFHGFSGWLIFMVSFVILIILSWLLKRTNHVMHSKVSEKTGRTNPTSGEFGIKHIKKSYTIIASFLFIGFWSMSSLLASAQIIPERKSFESFPTIIAGWEGENTYLSEEIQSSLWSDDYIQIRFRQRKSGDFLLLFIPYYEFQKSRHTAHAPAACLIGGGYAPRSRDVIAREFPPPFGQVGIGRMILEKENQLLLSTYWVQGRGRIISNEYINKLTLFWDAITKQRTDGALVRIEMPIARGRSIEEAQKVVDTFTMELMKILSEYVPR